MFATQGYLFSEFTGKFHGLGRSLVYLTDGGHFENMGVYELLRPERRATFVFACDHGADPDYTFGELANLIRLVRIDMQIELSIVDEVANDPVLGDLFGVPADFRKTRPCCVPACEHACPRASVADAKQAEHVAILLRATRGHPAATQTWVVLLKPRVRRDSAADVAQYALANPEFPQQTTADQFFDEAQWESYRKLAFDNASKIFDPPVWDALQEFCEAHR